jgi:hypothetical protein
MSRQVGAERARYGRKGLREQLGDLVAWPAAHPVATIALLFFLVVGSLFFGSRALGVRADDLRVGDCVFVRTEAAQEAQRPIGEPAVVSSVLLAGGAERAACDASHGHEVSAIVVPGGDIAGTPDPTTIKAATAPLCAAAFPGYVGHALEGSAFTTFPVVPDASAVANWVGGGRRTVCLVARTDGAWMDHPARASGE